METSYHGGKLHCSDINTITSLQLAYYILTANEENLKIIMKLDKGHSEKRYTENFP